MRSAGAFSAQANTVTWHDSPGCKVAAERAGVKMEKRTYHPHVTLAYLNSQTDPARLGAWVAQNNLLHSPPIRIERFGLYSSTLKGDGSLYQLEQVYRL